MSNDVAFDRELNEALLSKLHSFPRRRLPCPRHLPDRLPLWQKYCCRRLDYPVDFFWDSMIEADAFPANDLMMISTISFSFGMVVEEIDAKGIFRGFLRQVFLVNDPQFSVPGQDERCVDNRSAMIPILWIFEWLLSNL